VGSLIMFFWYIDQHCLALFIGGPKIFNGFALIDNLMGEFD